jgi:hypothetical protein
MLVAMLLPAVQNARESARRTQCISNLKNLTLAAVAIESAKQHLPGPYMNAHPATAAYTTDVGLFVTMLPFLEQQGLYNSFDLSVPSNSLKNKFPLQLRPNFLKCASSRASEMLSSLSTKFSGPSQAGLDGIACDYMGNDGTYVDGKPAFGAVRLRVGNVVRERRVSEVTDGTSNTLLFWESIGDGLYLPGLAPQSIDQQCPSTFYYMIDSDPVHGLYSSSQASCKSYCFSWTGFRVGTIVPNEAPNTSNVFGQPFAAHIGIFPCSKTDGSVHTFSQDIDKAVLSALATAQNGESQASELP